MTAVRRDIADVALADRLFAPHYARAETAICGADAAMITAVPGGQSVTQLLPGECFAVLDVSGEWAWGYCLHDSYVGCVRKAALAPVGLEPTHIVTQSVAPIFANRDIKSAIRGWRPVGSRVAGSAEAGFLALTDGGYLHVRHIAPVAERTADAAAVAAGLVGLPYVWGGRGGGGIDCSGLVQHALARACGIDAPRDSDQQRSVIGQDIPSGTVLARNDILFFPGHVGIMIDPETIVHANAHWMAVTIEPLAAVVARIANDMPDPITARRRLP